MTPDADSGRDPTLRLSRRAFFRALVTDARGLSGALAGQETRALAALVQLPLDELSRIVPMLNQGLSVVVEGERLVACELATGRRLDLLPATRQNLLTLNLFQSEVALGVVARRLAHQMGWSEEEALAHVRTIFLDLAGRLIFLPRNAPQPASHGP
ncbi:MAG: hypothetical protein JXA93_05065 [Anaerolineae bacterium]|nr:hypothetical protein [Anaerolineae bacterium]